MTQSSLARPAWRAGLRFHSWVALIYSAISLYLLGRVLPNFASELPGAEVALADAWQNSWNLWWTRYALEQGLNPYWTPLIFYPEGASLYLHTLNITNAIISMPINWLAGPLAAYNTAAFLGLLLSGIAAYMLALYLIKQRVIAAIVGGLFAFSPFHLAKVWDGHLSWITLYWVVFYTLALFITLDSGKRRAAIVAGVLLALASLTSWYFAIFSAVFTALVLLVRLPELIRAGAWRVHITNLVLMAGVALLLLAPVLLPTFRSYLYDDLPPPRYAESEQMPGWDGETVIYSADLLDIVFPSFLNPWWGDWSRGMHTEMRQVWFWQISPGIAVLLLAGIGTVTHWKRVWQIATLVLLLFLLMLGPRLTVAGIPTSIPLPHELLRYLPGMKLAHRPNHFAIFMLPLLMVLAGFGIQSLWNAKRSYQILLIGLGLIAVLEYAAPPFPTMAANIHPQIADLKDQSGAILDLPPDERTAAAMNNQMVHERPIVGGYLARQFDRPHFVEKLPWLRQLWQFYPDENYQAEIIPNRADDALQALRFYGIETIVIRRNELQDFQERDIQRTIATFLPQLSPSYSDDTLSIYELSAVEPRSLIYLGEGWRELEREGERSWRWMGDQAEIYAINPAESADWVTLRIRAESFGEARSLSIAMDGYPLGSFTIQPAPTELRLQLVLPAGEHRITLESPSTLSPEGRQLSLSVSQIVLEP
jgi:hypothetical protein